MASVSNDTIRVSDGDPNEERPAIHPQCLGLMGNLFRAVCRPFPARIDRRDRTQVSTSIDLATARPRQRTGRGQPFHLTVARQGRRHGCVVHRSGGSQKPILGALLAAALPFHG